MDHENADRHDKFKEGNHCGDNRSEHAVAVPDEWCISVLMCTVRSIHSNSCVSNTPIMQPHNGRTHRLPLRYWRRLNLVAERLISSPAINGLTLADAEVEGPHYRRTGKAGYRERAGRPVAAGRTTSVQLT